MATDDERRAVARRLRELEKGVIGAFIPTRELAENVLKAIDYGRSGAMTPYGCLADLIDPDCDEGRYSVARTARPIDRDALLALADELEEDADDIISAARNAQFTGVGPRMEEAKHDAYEWRSIAHRIREACGEVAE